MYVDHCVFQTRVHDHTADIRKTFLSCRGSRFGPLSRWGAFGVAVAPPAIAGALRRTYAPPAALKRTSAAIGKADVSAGRFTAVSEVPDACADILPRSTSVCSPSELEGSTSGNQLRFRGILTLFTVKLATKQMCIGSSTALLRTRVNTNRQPTWDTMRYCDSIRPIGGKLAATESRNWMGLPWLRFGRPTLAGRGPLLWPIAAPATSPVLWHACFRTWQVPRLFGMHSAAVLMTSEWLSVALSTGAILSALSPRLAVSVR